MKHILSNSDRKERHIKLVIRSKSNQTLLFVETLPNLEEIVEENTKISYKDYKDVKMM
jgi:hypothetical protein